MRFGRAVVPSDAQSPHSLVKRIRTRPSPSFLYSLLVIQFVYESLLRGLILLLRTKHFEPVDGFSAFLGLADLPVSNRQVVVGGG